MPSLNLHLLFTASASALLLSATTSTPTQASTITLVEQDFYPRGCKNTTAAEVKHFIVGQDQQCVPQLGKSMFLNCSSQTVDVFLGQKPPSQGNGLESHRRALDEDSPQAPPPMCVGQPNVTLDFPCYSYPEAHSFSFTCQTYNKSDILEWTVVEGGYCGHDGEKVNGTYVKKSVVYVKLNTCQAAPSLGAAADPSQVGSNPHNRRRRALDGGSNNGTSGGSGTSSNSGPGGPSGSPATVTPSSTGSGGSGSGSGSGNGGESETDSEHPIALYYREAKSGKIPQGQPHLLSSNSSFIFTVVQSGSNYNLTAAFFAGVTDCSNAPVKFMSIPINITPSGKAVNAAPKCAHADEPSESGDLRRMLQTTTTANVYTLLGDVSQSAVQASALTGAAGVARAASVVSAGVAVVVGVLLAAF